MSLLVRPRVNVRLLYHRNAAFSPVCCVTAQKKITETLLLPVCTRGIVLQSIHFTRQKFECFLKYLISVRCRYFVNFFCGDTVFIEINT